MPEQELLDPWLGFRDKIWQVHKFGGTSVASATCFEQVADIVEAQIGISSSVTSDSTEDCNDSLQKNQSTAVVLSAMGGKPKVTDLLLSTVKAAAARESDNVKTLLGQILKKHFDCIDALPLDKLKIQDSNNKNDWTNAAAIIKKRLSSDIADLKDILKTVSLMKWQANKISEVVSGYGELWSTQILSMLLSYRSSKNDKFSHHRFAYIDARRVIVIDEEALGAVCWEQSKQHLEQAYNEECNKQVKDANDKSICMHLVVTGYVVSNTEGIATTLQRDGSDYSAAIMGKLLQSNSINIWTDVDGVLSADPRRVPTAFPIPEVSYNEAMELAYFGAKVIHPKTMRPAINSKPEIPIYIKNTFFPSNIGTKISLTSTTHTDHERCVCGFSTIEHMAIINVEGSGMVGVKGVANRLFGALEHSGVNVVLISQASSEHSITFATTGEHAIKAKEAIEETFAKEIRQQHISEVIATMDCTIIAAVGDGMNAVAGVAGRFFSALGDSKINILAIAQGSSERNISAVIKMEDSTRALRAVHAAFRLSNVTVRVAIIGMNDIGESLLNLLHNQHSKLCGAFDVNLQVCVILKNSSDPDIVTLFNNNNENESISPQAYKDALSEIEVGENPLAKTINGGISIVSKYLKTDECAHTVVIDCTGEEKVGTYHPLWLDENIHVITANNSALSGPRSLRTDIKVAERKNGRMSAQYLPAVTVGGALPVLNTLKNLLQSGDKVKRICGIFSTSLSYILYRIAPPPNYTDSFSFDDSITGFTSNSASLFETLKDNNADCSFSKAVNEAFALGLMEENPVKDLSNEYTARCLMVIAKELGIDKEYDIENIQLMSDMLFQESDMESYEERIKKIDAQMKQRVIEARAKGCVPRHVSVIDVKTSKIEIRIMDVPNTHVYAITPPSCECVRFFTENLKQFPLVIQVSIMLNIYLTRKKSFRSNSNSITFVFLSCRGLLLESIQLQALF